MSLTKLSLAGNNLPNPSPRKVLDKKEYRNLQLFSQCSVHMIAKNLYLDLAADISEYDCKQILHLSLLADTYSYYCKQILHMSFAADKRALIVN